MMRTVLRLSVYLVNTLLRSPLDGYIYDFITSKRHDCETSSVKRILSFEPNS